MEEAGKTAAAAEPEPVATQRVADGEFPAGEQPLETSWTLWVDKKGGDRKAQDAYMASLQPIGTFNTVEGFFRYFVHLKRPSQFPRDHSLLVFRSGLKPMWEEFADGGCWNYRMRRGQESDEFVNFSWESTLLATIGELFETPNLVGCVMSSRVKDVAISVWNASDVEEGKVRFAIGEKFREVLALPATAQLEYKDHRSSLKDFSSYRNARKYVAKPGEE